MLKSQKKSLKIFAKFMKNSYKENHFSTDAGLL